MITYKETIKIGVYRNNKFLGNIINVDTGHKYIEGYKFIPVSRNPHKHDKVYNSISKLKYLIEKEDYLIDKYKENESG